MTVSNQTISAWFKNTGTDTSFSLPFDYLEGEESVIGVNLYDASDTDNLVKVSISEGVDYSIDSTSFPATSVEFSSPLPANHWLYIYRETHPVQETKVDTTYTFPAESMQEYMDRTTYLIQELFGITDRAIINSPESVENGTSVGIDDVVTSAVTIRQIVDPAIISYTPADGDILVIKNNIPLTINLPTGSAKDTIVIATQSSSDVTVVGLVNGVANDILIGDNYSSCTYLCVAPNEWIKI